MILTDLHTHTTFCDGENTPEEMVLAAIEKNMHTLGFSMHSYTSFDLGCCPSLEAVEDYRREIARLKQKYASQIRILCGIEQDFYSDFPAEGFDYVIGSVHYVKSGNTFYAVDDTLQIFCDAAEKGFGSDFLCLAEEYFGTVSKVTEKTGANIIGHFDLLCKFNADGRFFDENHPRYVAAYTKAVKELVKSGKPFEINTGAISRGYNRLYPSPAILRCIYENGGKVILSSDSHRKDTLCFEFEKYSDLARKIGFKL